MNIQDLLEELRQAGLSDDEIGKRVAAPQSIITRLRNGVHKTTSYQRGMAIANLAEQIRNNSQDAAA